MRRISSAYARPRVFRRTPRARRENNLALMCLSSACTRCDTVAAVTRSSSAARTNLSCRAAPSKARMDSRGGRSGIRFLCEPALSGTQYVPDQPPTCPETTLVRRVAVRQTLAPLCRPAHRLRDGEFAERVTSRASASPWGRASCPDTDTRARAGRHTTLAVMGVATGTKHFVALGRNLGNVHANALMPPTEPSSMFTLVTELSVLRPRFRNPIYSQS